MCPARLNPPPCPRVPKRTGAILLWARWPVQTARRRTSPIQRRRRLLPTPTVAVAIQTKEKEKTMQVCPTAKEPNVNHAAEPSVVWLILAGSITIKLTTIN